MTFERLRDLPDPDTPPALDPAFAHLRPALGLGDDQPPPRILLLYGSLCACADVRWRGDTGVGFAIGSGR